MSFGNLQTAITSSSGCVRGSSWYGWKSYGKVFPTPSSFLDFDIVCMSWDLGFLDDIGAVHEFIGLYPCID